MSMNQQQLKHILEAAILTADEPLSIDRLQSLFRDDERPEREAIKGTLEELGAEWSERSLELKQVGSGFRFQARTDLGPWLTRLNSDRAPRYSRALLETLALIVYRQPITRASIEEIRGVAVSSSIIKTLLEREWVKVVGYRDVPGKPALYGTTRKFLDDFNLKSLTELPTLAEIRPIDHMQEEFDLEPPAEAQAETPEMAEVEVAAVTRDEGAAGEGAAEASGDDEARVTEEEAVEA